MEGPTALDREVVVDAACRIVERVGAKALTMRMLADELGASTMAAYRHVPSKEALLVLVADRVLGRVTVPPPGAGTWELRLRVLERGAFAELSRVPDLMECVSDDAIYPSRERLINAVVEILTEAGFPPRAAALAHEMFFGYVLGQLKMRGQIEARRARRSRRSRSRADATVVLLGSVIVDGREQVIDFDEYFDFGLRILLSGLRQELEGAAEVSPDAFG